MSESEENESINNISKSEEYNDIEDFNDYIEEQQKEYLEYKKECYNMYTDLKEIFLSLEKEKPDVDTNFFSDLFHIIETYYNQFTKIDNILENFNLINQLTQKNIQIYNKKKDEYSSIKIKNQQYLQEINNKDKIISSLGKDIDNLSKEYGSLFDKYKNNNASNNLDINTRENYEEKQALLTKELINLKNENNLINQKINELNKINSELENDIKIKYISKNEHENKIKDIILKNEFYYSKTLNEFKEENNNLKKENNYLENVINENLKEMDSLKNALQFLQRNSNISENKEINKETNEIISSSQNDINDKNNNNENTNILNNITISFNNISVNRTTNKNANNNENNLCKNNSNILCINNNNNKSASGNINNDPTLINNDNSNSNNLIFLMHKYDSTFSKESNSSEQKKGNIQITDENIINKMKNNNFKILQKSNEPAKQNHFENYKNKGKMALIDTENQYKQFFLLTYQAIQLNNENIEDILNIDVNQLYEQSKKEHIPFFKFDKWIKNKIFINRISISNTSKSIKESSNISNNNNNGFLDLYHQLLSFISTSLT